MTGQHVGITSHLLSAISKVLAVKWIFWFCQICVVASWVLSHARTFTAMLYPLFYVVLLYEWSALCRFHLSFFFFLFLFLCLLLPDSPD